MKLFYYQRPDRQPNFGDELNHWLWPRLRPNIFDQDDSTTFIGTGTLLNNKLHTRVPTAKRLVIFGTGAGYELPLKRIPVQWDIHCVRGPFSARLLNLSPEKAITDGGLLVADVFTPPSQTTQSQAAPAQTTPPQSRYSFMPHIHSANDAAEHWQRICQQANVRYIDPRWPVEKVLNAIHSSELLLAEAMHGAIVADALRVPWIPITTGPRIYAFKWQDWCASVGLPYLPHRLPPLSDYPRWGRGVRSGSLAMRHWLRAGLESTHTTLQYALLANEQAIVKRLKNVTQQRSYLSREEIFQARLDGLRTCFEQVPASSLKQLAKV
ncbi:MAG: polysaccharide pyruvyl transferase family protein [Cyanobacteria bacterium J06635_11]